MPTRCVLRPRVIRVSPLLRYDTDFIVPISRRMCLRWGFRIVLPLSARCKSRRVILEMEMRRLAADVYATRLIRVPEDTRDIYDANGRDDPSESNLEEKADSHGEVRRVKEPVTPKSCTVFADPLVKTNDLEHVRASRLAQAPPRSVVRPPRIDRPFRVVGVRRIESSASSRHLLAETRSA